MNSNDMESGDDGAVLGNTVQVGFPSFGNRSVEGKVDTGATTSSMHATDITVNQEQGKVSFRSDVIGENIVTLELKGVQDVHSADGGGKSRPVVELDVTIDGKPIRAAQFNLNDRSNMDAMILVGQNILKSGSFTIDPNKGSSEGDQSEPSAAMANIPQRNESQILQAIEVLVENNIGLGDIVAYLQTVAVNRIKE